MSRLLTAGWENALEHPQRIKLTGWQTTPAVQYLPGGKGGIWFMQFAATATWPKSEHWMRAHYSITDSQEINLSVHVRPYWTAYIPADATKSEIAIYWFNGAFSGYIWLDDVKDQIGYSWGTQSDSKVKEIDQLEWYHIMLRVRADATGADIMEYWLNGVLEFEFDTNCQSDISSVDEIVLGHHLFAGYGNAGTTKAGWDNLIVNNTLGPIDNGSVGVRYLRGQRANDVGSWTQLTRAGTDSGNNWNQVDEVPPDGLEWVETEVSGERDSYNFENSPALIEGARYEVKKVIARWVAESTMLDGGAIKPFLVSGGSLPGELHYGAQQALTLIWTPYEEIWHENPAGGEWTQPAIDALEVGVEAT